MRQCAQQDYPSSLGICEDCDPLCDSCVGSGPLNCTSCANTRYTKCEHTLLENVYLYTFGCRSQVELDVAGPGGEPLFQCSLAEQEKSTSLEVYVFV